MDFSRIQYILTPQELADKMVVVVGLGSGGAPAVQHLAMNGIRKWSLFDPDVLDEVNLVKHPGLRKDLGRMKVSITAEWLEDRNPDSEIREYPENILDSTDFEREVRDADLVISATDTLSIRQFINRVCVCNTTPCVTASVFRTGLGGEVFLYIPEITGCYHCITIVSEKHEWAQIDNHIPMTPEEGQKIYGLGERNYRASGLSMDIGIISALLAKSALRFLLENLNQEFFPPENHNYTIFYLRRLQDYPSLSSLKYLIAPQKNCFCGASHNEEDKCSTGVVE